MDDFVVPDDYVSYEDDDSASGSDSYNVSGN